METFSALPALCEQNPPVNGGFPSPRPVTRSFDVFFDLRLNKQLSKQLKRRWFETPSCSLWRYCNGSPAKESVQKRPSQKSPGSSATDWHVLSSLLHKNTLVTWNTTQPFNIISWSTLYKYTLLSGIWWPIINLCSTRKTILNLKVHTYKMTYKMQNKSQYHYDRHTNIQVAWWRHRATEIWASIGSGNGFLPEVTTHLPEPMLANYQRGLVAFTWGIFTRNAQDI